METTQAAIPT